MILNMEHVIRQSFFLGFPFSSRSSRLSDDWPIFNAAGTIKAVLGILLVSCVAKLKKTSEFI